ncbi:MAG: hypothetical protein LC708_00115, partial [Actinobacteria bacterium]|nr:hypothetical protein [Actinomycetota bacterium]
TSGLSVTGADAGLADASLNGGATAYSSTSATATITVNFINNVPSFTAGPNQVILEDSGAQTVAGWATKISPDDKLPPRANEAGQVVDFIITTDNDPLFAVLPFINPTTGDLTYTPQLNASGSAIVTVRIHDNGGTAFGGVDTSAAQTFTINIAPVNDPPSFSHVGDQTVLEDSGARTVAGWASNLLPYPTAPSPLALDESGQALLNFVVSNDNNALFSVQPAVALNGTLTFTPRGNASGTATVTVQLRDDGGIQDGGQDLSPAQTFLITVTPVNDPPSFVKGPDKTVLEDAGPQSFSGWATGILAYPAAPPPLASNESTQALDFQVTNDNNALFTAQPAIAPNGTLTFTAAPNASGAAVVTVRLHDDGGTADGGLDTSAAQTFVITITQVNDAPSFTKGADQTVLEDAGPQSVANWATNMLAYPAAPPPLATNEGSQTLTFLVSASNPSLFAAGPAIDANGTLTYTTAPHANGSATISVRLQDNGGTSNGGSDTSLPQTFVINITAVNDPPTYAKGPDETVLEDVGAVSVSNWASAILAGPPDEVAAGQNLVFALTNNNNPLFSVQPSLSPTGVLTFTPATNANGTAQVTISASDDGGTANGGVNTSPPQVFVIRVVAVNDVPVFTKGADQTVLEDAGPRNVPNWATGISAYPASPPPLADDEAGQTLTFLISTNNSSLFAAGPAVDASGTLTYTTAPNANGSATVTVRLRDNGGTDNNGVDTSAAQTFVINVAPVNDAPSLIPGPAQNILEDAPAQNLTNWGAVLPYTGPPGADENNQTLTFVEISNNNNALFTVPPTLSLSGTLSYQTAPNANGSSTVTVRLRDNGGTANGGVDDSGAQTFTINVAAVNDTPSFTKGADQAVLEDV